MFNSTYAPKPKRPARLPMYRRAERPPKITFTERDLQALLAIYDHEGVLADYQLGRVAYGGVEYGKDRASKLYHNGYLWWPPAKLRAQLPFNVYFLDEKGIAEVAKAKQVPISSLHWRRPGVRFGRVPHDVELNDERIAITQDVARMPGLRLVEWFPEFVFGSSPDVIECRDANGGIYKKSLAPDGGFVVARVGEKRRYRFFRERERTFKSSSHFIHHKARPALAYITSEVYKARFGDNGGRFLVSVSSLRRIRNIVQQLERQRISHADWIYFTPHGELTLPGVMSRPLWYRAGTKLPFALFPQNPVF